MIYTKKHKLGYGILSTNGTYLIFIVEKYVAMKTSKKQ